MISLSPSALNLFADCGRCFWLERVKGISRPSGPFPSLPSGMDRVLKDHFDSHRTARTLPEALGTFQGSLFPDRAKLDVWRNNRQGLRYSPTAGTEFKGALDDLLVTATGTYAPLDFKTRGYPRKDDTHMHYQLQMDSYAYLLERNGFPSAGFALLLFYHPVKVTGSHQVEFVADPVSIATSPTRAEEAFSRAVACLQAEEPEPSPSCGFCRWEGAR